MPLAIERKNAHNKDDFQKYFKKYKDICIDKKIADEDVQNRDETKFHTGCSRAIRLSFLILMTFFNRPRQSKIYHINKEYQRWRKNNTANIDIVQYSYFGKVGRRK